MDVTRQIRISASTNKGMVRENNEDNHIFSVDVSAKQWSFFENKDVPENSKGFLLAVADGMGGMENGEVASQIAMETIKEYFDANYDQFFTSDENIIKKLLNELFIQANERIINFSKNEDEETAAGTTLVLVFGAGNIAYLAWTGDSRIYLFNNDEGLVQVSKDQSYVQDLVDKGKITQEQAFFHPDSNIITDYLGNPRQKTRMEFSVIQCNDNDKFLLCSDGLNGMLQDSNIEEILKNNENIEECTARLIISANDAGGQDNTTVILCEIKGIGSSARKSIASTAKQPKKKKIKIFVLLAIIVIAGLIIVFSGILNSNKNDNKVLKDTVVVKNNIPKPDTMADSDKDSANVEEENIEKSDIINNNATTVTNNIDNYSPEKTDSLKEVKAILSNLMYGIYENEKKFAVDSIIKMTSLNKINAALNISQKNKFCECIKGIVLSIGTGGGIFPFNSPSPLKSQIDQLQYWQGNNCKNQ